MKALKNLKANLIMTGYSKFFKKIVFSTALVITGIGTANFFGYSTYEGKENKTHQDYFNRDYRIYSLVIPSDMNFATEEVPVKLLDVKERLDRELHVNTYWQSNTLLYIKRANKYFPIIEPILAKNGIPEDFKYLALIESGLTHVVSPAGATGFWQIMKSTGRENGLEINGEVDERYHIEKSTEVACKYLNQAYEKFGSWTLAAASYNMGMNGMSKQLSRQKVDNYYDLLLNEETGRYVYRILAAKEILNNPQNYGFHFREKDLWIDVETEELTITGNVKDFSQLAKDHGINYKILKNYNPWLRQSYLTNKSGKTYTLKLPKQEYLPLLVRQDQASQE